jgi:drug/metabolite transporter (DMT)-like permease
MLFPSPVFEISALLNETILSLYPAVIKAVKTDTETMVLVRNITFCVLGFLLAKPEDIKIAFEPSFKNASHYLMMGSISFLVLTFAYNGFKELPLEICMPIFYSYPWIILLMGMYLGRKEPIMYVIPMVITYAMMIYFMKPTLKQIEHLKSFPPEKRNKKYLAILGCVAAAILSGANFFIYKSGIENHSTGTLRTFLGTLIISICYMIYNKRLPDLQLSVWLKLLFFNGCIAFVASRFKIASIKDVPEIYYASFIFMGALIGYAVGEKVEFFKQKSSEDFNFVK